MNKWLAGLLYAVLIAAASAPLPAQQAFSGTAEIEQSLQKLAEVGTVLMIAAHPDDERTGVLAYFARHRHMRTAYLSVTRGEGGQNLIGSEQGAQLGIIRTQELLAARRIDGAEQFFTRAIDFGFSKTAAETLEKWGHDRILSDMVWVIRRYRPDVVILVFSGTPRDGHGQHQVSAILGKEAYEAAGDPERFPEQLRYVEAWRPKRLVQTAGFGGRGGGRGGAAGPDGRPAEPSQAGRGEGPGGRGAEPGPPPPPPAAPIDTGAFDPILGYSYEDLAVMSRSMHHSQGTGAMRRPGPAPTGFIAIAGDRASKDLFEDIDTTWNRLPGGAAVATILEEAIRGFEPAHPEKTIPQLARARPLIAAISDPLAGIKLAELDETMALCAGLWADAQARQPEVTPGSPLSVTATVLNRSAARVTLEGALVEGIWNEALPNPPAKLGYNQSANLEFTRQVPASQPYSQPYWLVKPPAGDVYTVDDQKLIGLADTPPVAQVRLRLTIEGARVELVRPVHYRYADRAEGERVRPLAVVPAVALNLAHTAQVFPTATARQIQVGVKANGANATGEVRLKVPAGWKAEPRSLEFRVVVGEQEELTFDVTPPDEEATGALRAVATVAGREIASGMEVISYPHFPAQTLFPPAEAKLVRSDIQVNVRNIGYIVGAGDEMPDALRQLGLDVTLLSPSDLERGDLSRFEAIVAGVRAYNVRADLRANQPRLLDYVRNGGAYVVQYNTGDNALNIGPYPFTVPPGTRYRVSVEGAPVTFPHPDSPLLELPNRITPKDFEGWVQERGLYFATKWNPHYQTVLASHDPGEPPMEGGELWARYGKGVYIYTSYAWFRQLPAGVPGAFRLFANLLSAK